MNNCYMSNSSLYAYCGGIDCRTGEDTQFVYCLGLSPETPITLGESITLEATKCSPQEEAVKAMTLEKQGSLYGFGIAAALLWMTESQIII